jgi:hypothetical protein
VIYRLSRKILNFRMQMLGCKVELEQDLSIGTIFRSKNYQDVPLNLSINGVEVRLFSPRPRRLY